MQVIEPPGWPRAAGYSEAIATRGRQIYLAGQVGWNARHEFETDDFVGQVRQALQNIATILATAGAKPEHVVRMTWFVRSTDEYFADRKGLGEAYRSVMGNHYPAMTVVEIQRLTCSRARVEIEATAVVPD